MWAEAAALAVEHGHNRTARALRLDYYGLKRRLATARRRKAAKPGPAFVELVPPVGATCAVEIEDGAGARMRIEWRGGATPDLAALCRAFRDTRG
jgi:hypothetical protein